MKPLAIALVTGVIAAALPARFFATDLDNEVADLQAAKSLTAKFVLAGASSSSVQGSLSYSKPSSFKIDLGDHLIVCDGKTLWDLNRTDNTYTENDASIAPTGANNVLAWAGFFNKTPYKAASSIQEGASRTIRDMDLRNWDLQFPEMTVTILLNKGTGLAQGSIVKKGDSLTTTLASEVKASDQPLPDSTFTFTPPDGAKKVEKPVPAAVSYASVDAIFKNSCVGCHQSGGAKGGLDLSSYDALMQGGRSGKSIIPGDPDNSLLLQLVNGSKQPKMPRGNAAPLTAEQIQTISDWIKAGAKNP